MGVGEGGDTEARFEVDEEESDNESEDSEETRGGGWNGVEDEDEDEETDVDGAGIGDDRPREESLRSPIVIVPLRREPRVGCVRSNAVALMGVVDCFAATGMLAKLLHDALGSLIALISATLGSICIFLSVGLRRLSANDCENAM